MTASIVEVIQHYQRSIDNSQDNEARLLHCIHKLYNLPIKVEHLQETGVGKTVNSLRKFNGEIGVAAKTLVTKWKAMVAAEEEPMDTTPQSQDNETPHNDNGDADEPSPHNNYHEDDELHNYKKNSVAQSKHSEKDKNKERSHSSNSSATHKESSNKHTSSSSKHSNEKHKSSSSSSSSKDKDGHHKSSSKSSSKEREKEKTEHKSRDKHKDKDQDKGRERSDKRKDEKHQKSEKETKVDSSSSSSHKSSSSSSKQKSADDKHHSSSRDKDKLDKEKERSDKHNHKSSSKDRDKSKEEKSSTSSNDKKEVKSSSSSSHKSPSSSTKDTSETSERKKRHNSDTESNDFKSPQPKVAKVDKPSSSSKTLDSTSPTRDEEDDCFDSSMGTNFGDILGMLNMPTKKSKKSNKSSGASSSSKESPPKASTSNRKNGVSLSPAIYSPMSTPKTPTAKPDLLAPTAKLEPLDPSIALELPTISTNYRPMPLNQTVMDCVFNNSSSSRPVRTLTDAEALQHGISSKTMRTKIYSGTRTGQIFQVSSLFDMCIRILQKNIDALEYTGGVPFEVLRPVLERATPQQLFVFEDYNPYLMEDSDVLWQFHVSRNYRTQKRHENESWREMFMRCQEEEERRLSILKDSIKQSQKIAAAPVRKTQLAFIDSMVKPPRNVMRKQEQYGTKSKLVATPAARVASLQSVTPNAAKTGDQRLKVSPAVRDHAQVASSSVRNKKAPLMQKTLAFMRGRLKR